jgi:replication factor A2
MISQIYKQKDEVIEMWGFTYKMLKLVTIVRKIEHSSTKITYTLEDITGTINGHLWIEEGEAPSSSSTMEGTYARVVGSIRHQGDSKNLMIFNIQPVKSLNEVNTHYLEAIHCRYKTEDLYRGGSGNLKGFGMSSTTTDVNMITDSQQPKGKPLAVFQAIQAISQVNSEIGASRHELAKKFPHITAQELAKILDDLSAEGNIYSTINQDHFLSCY